MIMKSENNRGRVNGSEVEKVDEKEHGIINTYLLLWKVVKLPAVVSLIGILLTVKVNIEVCERERAEFFAINYTLMLAFLLRLDLQLLIQ